jgi:hypothetical protein
MGSDLRADLVWVAAGPAVSWPASATGRARGRGSVRSLPCPFWGGWVASWASSGPAPASRCRPPLWIRPGSVHRHRRRCSRGTPSAMPSANVRPGPGPRPRKRGNRWACLILLESMGRCGAGRGCLHRPGWEHASRGGASIPAPLHTAPAPTRSDASKDAAHGDSYKTYPCEAVALGGCNVSEREPPSLRALSRLNPYRVASMVKV